MLTHDVNIRMPEVMFDGAIFRIEPRSIEGNGMLAKLEFVPRTAVQARADATPRILFKKISEYALGMLDVIFHLFHAFTLIYTRFIEVFKLYLYTLES